MWSGLKRNRKSLKGEVKAAKHKRRTQLPSMKVIYLQSCRKRADVVLAEPQQHSNRLAHDTMIIDSSTASGPGLLTV